MLSVLCRVSCVPTSCFLIWFVSCPCLMSLVNSCPAVFVLLSMIYLCILVHACSVWCGLVYLLFPVYPVCEYCLVMSCLDVLLNIIIWVYILVCVFLFLPRVCTVTNVLYSYYQGLKLTFWKPASGRWLETIYKPLIFFTIHATVYALFLLLLKNRQNK